MGSKLIWVRILIFIPTISQETFSHFMTTKWKMLLNTNLKMPLTTSSLKKFLSFLSINFFLLNSLPLNHDMFWYDHINSCQTILDLSVITYILILNLSKPWRSYYSDRISQVLQSKILIWNCKRNIIWNETSK